MGNKIIKTYSYSRSSCQVVSLIKQEKSNILFVHLISLILSTDNKPLSHKNNISLDKHLVVNNSVISGKGEKGRNLSNLHSLQFLSNLFTRNLK